MIALDKFGPQEDVCLECTHTLKREKKKKNHVKILHIVCPGHPK